jgi:hypothetical protein
VSALGSPNALRIVSWAGGGAAHRIVDDLVDAGYVSRTRTGRRNRYAVHRALPLPDRLVQEQSVGDLLAVLTPPASDQRPLP